MDLLYIINIQLYILMYRINNCVMLYLLELKSWLFRNFVEMLTSFRINNPQALRKRNGSNSGKYLCLKIKYKYQSISNEHRAKIIIYKWLTGHRWCNKEYKCWGMNKEKCINEFISQSTNTVSKDKYRIVLHNQVLEYKAGHLVIICANKPPSQWHEGQKIHVTRFREFL